jgi:type IV pilus assembly protein PilQ
MTPFAMMNLKRAVRTLLVPVLVALGAGAAQAQDNAIESISANQQGANVVVNIAMKNAPAKLPLGFAITNPARIALDFGATSNATGKSAQEINLGEVRGVNVVQAGERTRLVMNLKRAASYSTAIDGKSVVVTVAGGPAVAAPAAVAPAQTSAAPAIRQTLRNLDFRRGQDGEGRVVVDLPNNAVAVDVRQLGNKVQVDFMNTGLPETLRRRLDVTDFGTPVSRVTTSGSSRCSRATPSWWLRCVRSRKTRINWCRARKASAARRSVSISRTSKCAPRCRRSPTSRA